MDFEFWCLAWGRSLKFHQQIRAVLKISKKVYQQIRAVLEISKKSPICWNKLDRSPIRWPKFGGGAWVWPANSRRGKCFLEQLVNVDNFDNLDDVRKPVPAGDSTADLGGPERVGSGRVGWRVVCLLLQDSQNGGMCMWVCTYISINIGNVVNSKIQ